MCVDFDNIGWFIADSALIVMSFFFFMMSAVKDPGYLKKPKNISFLVISNYYLLISKI
jgi:uncharacterized membrane protein